MTASVKLAISTKPVVNRFRSGLEERVAQQIEVHGLPVVYETDKINFTYPARDARYTPDFKVCIGDHTFYVETKGIFSVGDRQKHLLIKEQCPDIDIRFVFSSSKSKLYKGSPTTYATWCEKHGFTYADKLIPVDWLSPGGQSPDM